MDGMRVTIDGLDLSAPATTVTIDPGMVLWDAVHQLGGEISVDHVPYLAAERTISAEAAEFIRDYRREEADSVLAVYWRHHSLEAEEFDSTDEAERFLESGEEYGTLASEAIVDPDGRITVCA